MVNNKCTTVTHPPSMNRLNSFKGCWTCKARKIKCDERPITCHNCEKKGIVCGGYDVRLQWVSDPLADPIPSTRGRRAIELDQDSGQRYRIEEIDGFLANVDNDTEFGLLSTRGPFSAFPSAAGNHRQVDTCTASSTTCFSIADTLLGDQRSSGQEKSFDINRDDENSTSQASSSHFSPASNFYLLGESEEHKEVGEGPRVHGISLGIRADQSNQTPYFEDHSQADSATTSLISSHSGYSIHHLSSSLFGDRQVDQLINHYNSHVADLMQPIFHTENVFRGIYLSAALEGSVVCMSDPNTSKALAYSAIYHSLLASSAFHLWNCNKAQVRYQRIGTEHRYQALCFLQAAVDAATPGADYQMFMTAMLSLLSIGTMSGEGNDFTVHINAATQLRTLRSRWKVISHSTQKLNSISAFLAILARTTSFQSAQSPGYTNPTPDDSLVQSSNCYEHIYGITPSIAAAIQETCRLAQLLKQYNGQPQDSVPGHILEACEALGDRLLSWRLTSESITSISPNDNLMFSIFTLQANAWHRAALIYYYRRIQYFNSTDLVDEVQYVAEQMHAAEDVKAQISQDPVMAPITWPAFIASCEAVGPQRDSFRRWWERIEKYNIGNITRQWDIVQKLWKRDDQMQNNGLGPADWIDSFRLLGFDVLAV
ncbi:fungal-specific transcription factor domain-containing protein [Dactylonectria estremocensis]|uniref:Fungal-specific transcription factor domain-containing protein n=1 Tax=Dactylonectria estremocensis TaxID=1079267 RepID=A0A9P9EN41_9HYPO|nr:fungal-specific transcription factor domain-containing protein [Dactylonectria estremocensis]